MNGNGLDVFGREFEALRQMWPLGGRGVVVVGLLSLLVLILLTIPKLMEERRLKKATLSPEMLNVIRDMAEGIRSASWQSVSFQVLKRDVVRIGYLPIQPGCSRRYVQHETNAAAFVRTANEKLVRAGWHFQRVGNILVGIPSLHIVRKEAQNDSSTENDSWVRAVSDLVVTH